MRPRGLIPGQGGRTRPERSGGRRDESVPKFSKKKSSRKLKNVRNLKKRGGQQETVQTKGVLSTDR